MSIEPFVRGALENWAEEITADIIQEARKNGLEVDMSLINSVYHQVVMQGDNSGEVQIIFEDSGRFVEMKKTGQAGGTPMVEALTEWVQKKGLTSGKVPGYDNPSSLTESEAARRIALGITFNSRKRGKRKSKMFWSAIVYGGLNLLIGRLAFGYGIEGQQEIVKTLKS